MKLNTKDSVVVKIDVIFLCEEFLFVSKEAFFLNCETLSKQNKDNLLDIKECLIICEFIQKEILSFLKLYCAMCYKQIPLDNQILEKNYNYILELLKWKTELNCYLSQPKHGFQPFLSTVLKDHPKLKEKYEKYMDKNKKDFL